MPRNGIVRADRGIVRADRSWRLDHAGSEYRALFGATVEAAQGVRAAGQFLQTAQQVMDAVREAYQQQPDAMMISRINLDPLEVVAVHGTGDAYRIPATINDADGSISFGKPVPVSAPSSPNAYPDPPGTVKPGVPGGSPSLPAPKFGPASPGNSTGASRGVSARDTERILAAVARGAILPSRVEHWTAQAASGHDISALDQLAAPSVAAGQVDIAYSRLFGPETARDDGGPEYQALFGDGTVEGAQQAADAYAAAARSTAAAMSDEELHARLFNPGGAR